MLSKLKYYQLTTKNLKTINNFFKTEDKGTRITEKYLNWWYLEKKFSDSSFVFLKYRSSIVSIATINNQKININKKLYNIGLPQNVITSSQHRGKGFFQKTFFECEKRNTKKNVNHYITFTNKLSTPIFLKKFNYIKGKCPNVVVIPIISFSFKKIKISKVKKFNTNFLYKSNNKEINNSIYKDKEYMRWRYEKSIFSDVHILEFKKNNLVESYAIIKFSYRYKIKVCYLLDIIGKFNIRNLKELKKYIFKNKSFLLLFLDNEQVKFFYKYKINLKFKNQFNFLVKNNSKNNKFDLSNINFNLSFGDIDFINYA